MELAQGRWNSRGTEEDDSRAIHLLNVRRTTPYNLRITTSCRCLYMVVVGTRCTDHGASAVHAVGNKPWCAL